MSIACRALSAHAARRRALSAELAANVNAATQTAAQHAQMMATGGRRQRLHGRLGVRRR